MVIFYERVDRGFAGAAADGKHAEFAGERDEVFEDEGHYQFDYIERVVWHRPASSIVR